MGMRIPRTLIPLAGKNTLAGKGARDMSDAILVSIITGGLSLLGIIYSSSKSAGKVDTKLEKQQAVIETKLNELAREVREHNHADLRYEEEYIPLFCI